MLLVQAQPLSFADADRLAGGQRRPDLGRPAEPGVLVLLCLGGLVACGASGLRHLELGDQRPVAGYDGGADFVSVGDLGFGAIQESHLLRRL